MKSALLVIDFQNTIFTDPPAYQVALVLQRIRNLISKARDAGLSIIYVQHEEAGTTWQKGSETWKFPEAIAPKPNDFVSPKSISDAFQDSALQAHLVEQGIGRMYICGYATEFCIDTNVRRAASGKLQTVVVSDAHTTRDRPHMKAPAIIEHHNWVWCELGTIQLIPSNGVDFSAD
ncbi:MAG: isochorismatase family protein [Pseudomonadota bacterium]